MSNIITAIDIGSSTVKALVASVDEDGKAKVIGESSHPAYGIKKGEVTGIEEAINSIATALTGAERMAGITVSSAYVSINGKNIISNNNKGVVAIADSAISEDDVFRAIEQARTVAIPQSRQIIHTIPREFIVDQQSGIKNPIEMTGSRLEVDAHIISAPVTAIHNIERCIQSIGLKLDGIVFSGWASSKSVLTQTEKELGVLLLDIGGGTTTVTTFVEDAVTYSACIPFGGSNVTRDLAAGLRMSLDDAEKVKINAQELIKEANKGKKAEQESDILDITNLDLEVEDLKTISKKFFLEIINERVKEIFILVKENIEQSGNEYQLPAGLVITGGSSNLPGMTNLAKEVFGVPATIRNPRGLHGLTDAISSSAFASLQGLALYGMEDDGSHNRKSGGVKLGSGSSVTPGSIASKVVGFFKNLLP